MRKVQYWDPEGTRRAGKVKGGSGKEAFISWFRSAFVPCLFVNRFAYIQRTP